MILKSGRSEVFTSFRNRKNIYAPATLMKYLCLNYALRLLEEGETGQKFNYYYRHPKQANAWNSHWTIGRHMLREELKWHSWSKVRCDGVRRKRFFKRFSCEAFSFRCSSVTYISYSILISKGDITVQV